MENVITQVHNVSGKELLGAIQRLEEKINNLSKGNQPSRKRSIKELSEHCGVSQNTVRNWITEGKLKAQTIGRRIFIEEEEFQKALSEVKSLKYQRA